MMNGKPKTLEEAIDVCGELNLGWKSSFDVMVDLAEKLEADLKKESRLSEELIEILNSIWEDGYDSMAASRVGELLRRVGRI